MYITNTKNMIVKYMLIPVSFTLHVKFKSECLILSNHLVAKGTNYYAFVFAIGVIY